MPKVKTPYQARSALATAVRLGAGPAEIAARRRDLDAANCAAAVRRMLADYGPEIRARVDMAPLLTDDQRTALALALDAGEVTPGKRTGRPRVTSPGRPDQTPDTPPASITGSADGTP